MPRTFSLSRLMLGITLFCVVCATAAYYGKDFETYLLLASLFVPTAIVCLVVANFAKNRIIVLGFSILGAFIFSIFMPAIQGTRHGNPDDPWTFIGPLVFPMATIPPLGALVFGVTALADELLNRRRAESLIDDKLKNQQPESDPF